MNINYFLNRPTNIVFLSNYKNNNLEFFEKSKYYCCLTLNDKTLFDIL